MDEVHMTTWECEFQPPPPEVTVDGFKTVAKRFFSEDVPTCCKHAGCICDTGKLKCAMCDDCKWIVSYDAEYPGELILICAQCGEEGDNTRILLGYLRDCMTA